MPRAFAHLVTSMLQKENPIRYYSYVLAVQTGQQEQALMLHVNC
jgi:hypothetical protein